jgi:TM2 domain-containing membrane protein YozV
MNQQMFMMPGLEPDELVFLQEITKDMTEAQQQQFYIMYSHKRKDQQTMMLLCLIGLVGFAGIHRLISGDIALGIIFFLTGGFCLIGTIIDAVNIKSITYEHNRRQGIDAANMVRMMMK